MWGDAFTGQPRSKDEEDQGSIRIVAMAFWGRLAAAGAVVIALGCAASGPLSVRNSSEHRVQVDYFGYFVLPPGYEAYFSRMWDDAREGCFKATGDRLSAPQIHFGAGLVSPLIFEPTADFDWIKQENDLPGLRYGRRKDGTLLVAVGGVNLSAKTPDDQSVQFVLGIARSYKDIGGRCQQCDDVKAVRGRPTYLSATVYEGCD
jgi:hypothetical protein